MKRIALLLLILPLGSYAQSRQMLSLQEIFETALGANSEEVLIYDGYQIINDLDLDLLRQNYPDNVTSEGLFQIPVSLELTNCSVDKELSILNLSLNSLRISGSVTPSISLKNSTFNDLILEGNRVTNSINLSGLILNGLTVNNNQVGYEIYLEQDSIVNGDVYIESNLINEGELDLIDIYVKGSVTIGDNETTSVYIEGSNFILPEYGEFNNYQLPGSNTLDLYLIGNTFQGDSTARVSFNKGSYLNLDVRNNTFDLNVYFIENQVNDRLFFVDNNFNQFVSFEKFLFSEIWNEVYWDQFSGYKIKFVDYGALQEGELDDTVRFKNLINIYKGLHAIFLSRGDLQSANACYSEMMQLQGHMLKHIYRENGGFGNFFRWQLNVLLEIYTEHGTDPALAVIVSLYVILIFTILYLFFPSEWDKGSREQLLLNYEKMLQKKGKVGLIPILVVSGSVMLTFINAVTLSINSFVTLGFGSIPTRGLARYLCIIEGFIGWFLLSIFTVALINQVLV